MKLIVGLGNPGKEYQATRHNVGWLVLDVLAIKLEAGEWTDERDFESEIASASAQSPTGYSEKILLIKPTTFMNNIGRAVEQIRAYYKLEPADMIVVHDELDLPLGTVRTQQGGSSAGHNGVGSIIHHLGTDQFWRVRLGIDGGQPSRSADTTNYVLQPFAGSERALVDQIVDDTALHLVDWLGSWKMPETSFIAEQ